MLERYEMNWLGKSFIRNKVNEPLHTIMSFDSNWEIGEVNSESKNLLIQGENLEALKHLLGDFFKAIKMIYINPPNNTKSKYFYYDEDNFSLEKIKQTFNISEEEAERVQQNIEAKELSDSAWLSFMYPHLFIAKLLLKEDGLIFITVDESKCSLLKLMMNEVFGTRNFILQKKIKNLDNLTENKYLFAYGKNEVKFNVEEFATDKKSLILFATKPNEEDIILDFFVDLEIIGEDVMQLNAEDGGNRRFILVQLNEHIDPEYNKEVYEFLTNKLKVPPTYFEITKECLKGKIKKIELKYNIKNGIKVCKLMNLNELVNMRIW